jgi:hypothetical protein
MKRAGLPDVNTGVEVFTADNQSLGTIAEVGDVSFKVSVPLAKDIWLGRDYIIESTPERVYMSFERADLNAYKLGQPGLTAEKDTTQESLVDAAVPPEQQEHQRLRMEQELAEQRRNLPHSHPGGQEYLPPETVGGTVGEPVEEELRRAGLDPMRDAKQENRGHDVEEFSDTDPFVDAASSTDPYESRIDYATTTGSRAGRSNSTNARLAIVMAGAAGVTFFLLMRRRRKNKPGARMKDAAREAAEAAREAGRIGVERAREAIESRSA